MNALKALLDAGMRPVRHGLESIVQSLVWSAIIAVLALLTVGYALASIHIWLAERYGALPAALIITGAFLVLTIVAFAVKAMLQASRRAQARREAEQGAQALRSALGSVSGVASAVNLLRRRSDRQDDRQARAVRGPSAAQRMEATARSTTRRVGPWTVVGVALVSGFVGAHMIDRRRA